MSLVHIERKDGRAIRTGDADSGVDSARSGQVANQARRKRWEHLRPQSALIYVENRCHLRCEHCYESDDSHPRVEGLSLDDYDRIFDELRDLGVLYLVFTGGEIFLRRDMLDIIALARRKRFSVELFTSGTHIDEAKADRLAELKVSQVEVSVYSHRPEVHDGFTGAKGSWERSTRALKLLNERGIATRMKANVMTFNVDHIEGLIELAENLGAVYRFDPTVKPKMNGDRSPLRFAVSPDELRRKVFSNPKLYEAFRLYEPDKICTGERSLLPEAQPICGAARKALSIGADGEVMACGFFASSVGSLKEHSLDTLWFESRAFDEIRQTTVDKMTSCGSCEVKNTCIPCMAYGEIEHGDHRGCASSSRQAATALHLLAERKAQANAKMTRGHALNLVGDLEVPLVTPNGTVCSEP